YLAVARRGPVGGYRVLRLANPSVWFGERVNDREPYAPAAPAALEGIDESRVGVAAVEQVREFAVAHAAGDEEQRDSAHQPLRAGNFALVGHRGRSLCVVGRGRL